jgi:hypothetical protein
MKTTKTKNPRSKNKKTAATAGAEPTRLRLPEVEGKTLEFVEVWLESDDNHIELAFADKTALHLDLEAGFRVYADYADWKTHNLRRIKKWPPLCSQSLQT